MKNTIRVLILMLAAVLTYAAALPVYAAEENDTARIRQSSEKVLQEITSRDDDWSIPDEYRFVQNYSLRESIVMPDPAGSDKAGAYQYNEDAIRAIKQQLYDNHRAVCVSFCAESFLPGQDTSDKLYMSDKWAHYTFKTQSSNHTVAIVGWDGIPYDPEAKAVSDRATGYFWISYADRSLNDPEAFIFEKVPDQDPVYTRNETPLFGERRSRSFFVTFSRILLLFRDFFKKRNKNPARKGVLVPFLSFFPESCYFFGISFKKGTKTPPGKAFSFLFRHFF